MNIPRIVDNKILAALASPGDTVAVRVIVRRVNNNNPFRIHGKTRHYVATHDRAMGVHCIDVPLSVWMDGIASGGAYRDNLSIAHDLQGDRSQSAAPLIFLVVPFGNGAVVPAQAPEAAGIDVRVLNALRTLSEVLEAPQIMTEAFDLAASGKPVEEVVNGLLATALSAQAEGDDIELEERDTKAVKTATDAAERMRKMRAAKKAKQAEKEEALM